MKLEPKHYAVIAGLLTGLATQLLSAQHGWSDIATPGFVAGLLIQVASAITAIFVGAPGAAAALERANQNTDMANASTRAALADPVDLGKVDPKRFIPPVVVLLCALGLSACGPKAYHNAVVADVSLSQALFALDDAEHAAFTANLITPAKHAVYSATILKLLQAGDDLTLALKAWDPTKPPPANIGIALDEVQKLLTDLNAESPTLSKVIFAAQAVLSVLRGSGVLPSDALDAVAICQPRNGLAVRDDFNPAA